MQLHKLCRRWEVACVAGAKRGGGGGGGGGGEREKSAKANVRTIIHVLIKSVLVNNSEFYDLS